MGFNRRDLFRMIGLVADGSVMYEAMTSLGYAQVKGLRSMAH